MRKIILISVLLVAVFVRFYDLSGNRPSLTNDEAALGYNAYSILQTGRDEHGEFMPIIFKSFGDWKPGLYVYLTVPSVAIFGLNEFSTRLPSALSGVIAVLLIYLISKKLFPKEKNIAFFSAFFLALNPWHITFSRGAWEANVALTLLLAGIYFYLHSLKRNKYLLISALFFGLTLWTYQSAKLATFLVVAILVYVYRKKFIKIKFKYIGLAFLIGLLISLPVLHSLTTGKAGRIEVMSVFSYERPQEYIFDTITRQTGEEKGDLVFSIFHPEWFNFTRGIFGRYFNHFSARFLFFEGDWSNPRHTSPYVGYFLLVDLFLILSGVFLILRNKEKSSRFVFLWLALAPLASILTRDSIHGVRSLNMLIPIILIMAYGANKLIKNKTLLVIGSLIYLVNFIYFWDAYGVHGKINYAKYHQYGYKQSVQRVLAVQDNYDDIIFFQSYGQPYIYFLFYGTDYFGPEYYQQNSGYVDSGGSDVGQVKKLGKIEFRDINWSADKLNSGTLLVGHEIDFPLEEIDVSDDYRVERIYYPDGTTAFVLVQVL